MTILLRGITQRYDQGIVAHVEAVTLSDDSAIKSEQYSWEVKQYDKDFQSGYRATQAEALAACEECIPALMMPAPQLSHSARHSAPSGDSSEEKDWRESGPQCWVKDQMIVTRFKDRVLSTVSIHASITMSGPVDKADEAITLAEAMQARWERAVPKLREAMETEAKKYGFMLFGVPTADSDDAA